MAIQPIYFSSGLISFTPEQISKGPINQAVKLLKKVGARIRVFPMMILGKWHPAPRLL